MIAARQDPKRGSQRPVSAFLKSGAGLKKRSINNNNEPSTPNRGKNVGADASQKHTPSRKSLGRKTTWSTKPFNASHDWDSSVRRDSDKPKFKEKIQTQGLASKKFLHPRTSTHQDSQSSIQPPK